MEKKFLILFWMFHKRTFHTSPTPLGQRESSIGESRRVGESGIFHSNQELELKLNTSTNLCFSSCSPLKLNSSSWIDWIHILAAIMLIHINKSPCETLGWLPYSNRPSSREPAASGSFHATFYRVSRQVRFGKRSDYFQHKSGCGRSALRERGAKMLAAADSARRRVENWLLRCSSSLKKCSVTAVFSHFHKLYKGNVRKTKNNCVTNICEMTL